MSLVFTSEDSPMANLLLPVMGAFAEFERSLMRENGKASSSLSSAAPRRTEKAFTPEREAELVQRPGIGVPKAVLAP